MPVSEMVGFLAGDHFNCGCTFLTEAIGEVSREIEHGLFGAIKTSPWPLLFRLFDRHYFQAEVAAQFGGSRDA